MSDRISRFIAAMQIQPNDRVLEIGCGHGLAATLVCASLAGGRYLAIDRSQKMISAAATRNAAFVQTDVARFMLGSLETLAPEAGQFDKVFAMRVRLFVEDPERAHALARRWLAPGGRIFVEYDEPPQKRR